MVLAAALTMLLVGFKTDCVEAAPVATVAETHKKIKHCYFTCVRRVWIGILNKSYGLEPDGCRFE
jgi:hypothetical protein